MNRKTQPPNPSIVSLITSGIDPVTDVYYIALPLCGPDLRELKRKTPNQRFTLYTSLWISLNALEALDFLHSKCNIIHRDVKPSNFVLATPKDLRDLRIIDFGLASDARFGKAKNKFLGTLRYSSLNATSGQVCFLIFEKSV
jgi:serine/threonine protein kinase